MSLVALIYRCPECGHDPTEPADGDAAHCSECGRNFLRGAEGGMVRIEGVEGAREVRAAELVREIERLGGPFTRARGDAGELHWGADATARRASLEEPVRHQGRLAGYVERFGAKVPGRLTLEGGEVRFDPAPPAPESPVAGRWSLTELRALQAASSSVQFSLPDDSMIEFRFTTDSPRRWESLLRGAIREAWAAQGREVVEFQPRIRLR